MATLRRGEKINMYKGWKRYAERWVLGALSVLCSFNSFSLNAGRSEAPPSSKNRRDETYAISFSFFLAAASVRIRRRALRPEKWNALYTPTQLTVIDLQTSCVIGLFTVSGFTKVRLLTVIYILICPRRRTTFSLQFPNRMKFSLLSSFLLFLSALSFSRFQYRK